MGSPIRRRGPRCPSCGRRVHRLPGGRLLSVVATPAGGWGLADHRCLPRGARYPPAALPDWRPTADWMAAFLGLTQH